MSTEMENGTQMTLEEYMPEIYQEQTYGASDSPARTSPLPEDKLGFKETAQAYFSELCTFLDNSQKKKDPMSSSLRMLKTCFLLMGDGISPNFSLKWTQSGMMQSGQFSTLKIGEFHRAEKGVLLSDILEKEVDPKYFLSSRGGVYVTKPVRIQKEYTKLLYV